MNFAIVFTAEHFAWCKNIGLEEGTWWGSGREIWLGCYEQERITVEYNIYRVFHELWSLCILLCFMGCSIDSQLVWIGELSLWRKLRMLHEVSEADPLVNGWYCEWSVFAGCLYSCIVEVAGNAATVMSGNRWNLTKTQTSSEATDILWRTIGVWLLVFQIHPNPCHLDSRKLMNVLVFSVSCFLQLAVVFGIFFL